ncbi:patatin-like phospholipase family protein [Thomasclavelia saccharogumia]|uniref:patatin-like phospholipase family protein n=1 Tax=Thomasclavelia saccharogumia TaxID=341225 RepID=UPI00047C2B66|nr:patatin-like phospholipase family protein [Thomasclavelia saccharogumia]
MKQALVLAGGGAKGAYQAGCIKALQEMNYEFDIVTGTSIGALNALLVVQQDYESLYQLWDKINISNVLKDPINLDFSFESMISQTNLIKPFFKSYLDEKGADITPLKKLIHSYYNDKKFFNSKIDYGIVTVKYPSLSPVEITKQKMQSNEPVEFAIASASCFPAFPVHHIKKQGYIDGGYYDNLPISLALKMKADKIIAIELSKEANHEYYIDRPYITLIRPSYDLGGFLDFNRNLLDWRIKLGYYDTLKTFNKLMGYRFNFHHASIDLEILNRFYWSIINFEDAVNKSIINKSIFNSNRPLTDLLKADIYLHKLELSDYFIRGVEIAMEYYHYQSDIIYDFNNTYLEIFNTFSKDYHSRYPLFENSFRDFSLKDILTSIKKLSSKDAICIFYHLLKNHEKIEPNLINNLFLNEYLIALLFSCIK